jgi:hypothetical protein
MLQCLINEITFGTQAMLDTVIQKHNFIVLYY